MLWAAGRTRAGTKHAYVHHPIFVGTIIIYAFGIAWLAIVLGGSAKPLAGRSPIPHWRCHQVGRCIACIACCMEIGKGIRMFIDQVEIHVRSGKGGDGMVHFRREKFVPRGGPDGGDGGKGGDVIFEVKATLNTLSAFRQNQKFMAENGIKGGPSQMTGRVGKDLIIHVPPGTVIFDAETGELIGDLTEPGQQLDRLQRRARRTRQSALCDFAQPGAAHCRKRRTVRRETPQTGIEADRRYRADRRPERGQIHAALGADECQTKDRAVSIHHA